jgi:hypothetical protein
MEEAPESIGWGCLSASTMPHNIEAFGESESPEPEIVVLQRVELFISLGL